MKVIKADHDRRLVIPGVPGLARRPVDIDASQTGFTTLRTLRIYRFDAESLIKGHAEEDEVFVVVLSGSIELKIGLDNSEDALSAFTLAAAGGSGSHACAAYLPPHSSYQLTPFTNADIAYARATPLDHRQPAVFHARACATGAEVDILLDERTHASRLRLRMVHVNAKDEKVTLQLLDESDAMGEALMHVQSSPAEHAARIAGADGEPTFLRSWDTVALNLDDPLVLDVAKGAFVSIMTVRAV